MDEKLLHEIKEVLDKIDETQKDENIPHVKNKGDKLSRKKPFSLNNIFLQSGMFFFLVFLLSISQQKLFFNTLSSISFIVLAMGLLKTSADIFYYKKSDGFSLILGIAFLFIVGFSYYALWSYVLINNSLLLSILLGLIIFLTSIFYLIHAYKSYIENKAKNESIATALIISSSWFLLLVSALYNNAILYLLLIIATLFVIKAVLDFSQRFIIQRGE